MNRSWAGALLAVASIVCQSAHAISFDKTLTGVSDCKAFVGRFCFADSRDGSDKGGHLTYTITFPRHHKNLHILMFYNAESSWEMVSDGKKTCNTIYTVADKSKNAFKVATSSNQLQTVNARYEGVIIDGENYWKYSDSLGFRTARPRWFFMQLVNVDWEKCRERQSYLCQGGLVNITVSTTMMNGDSHFSFDEDGILTMTIIFLALEFCVLIAGLIVGYMLRTRGMLHHTYKLVMAAVFIYFCGLTVMLDNLRKISAKGKSNDMMEFVARMCFGISDTLLILQITLIALGWTIVKRKLVSDKRMLVAFVATLYILLYAAFLAWATHAVKPEEVYHYYQSYPGYFMVFMRGCTTIWFIGAVSKTILDYRKKVRFYKKFMVLGACWILSLPLFFGISFGIAVHQQKKWMYGFECSFSIMAHIIYTLMYNPSTRFNKGFPFHATTDMMKSASQREAEKPAFGKGSVSSSSRNALPSSGMVSRSFELAMGKMRTVMDGLLYKLSELHEISDMMKMDANELEYPDEDLDQELKYSDMPAAVPSHHTLPVSNRDAGNSGVEMAPVPKRPVPK